MTDSLIRTAARRPLSALARPSVVAAFALLLAYGGGAWLNILHTAEGGDERNGPPFLLPRAGVRAQRAAVPPSLAARLDARAPPRRGGRVGRRAARAPAHRAQRPRVA